MNRLSLIGVLIVCATALMTASAARSSDHNWPDPDRPFSDPIEVCSEDQVPDVVSVNLPPEFDLQKVMVVKLRSETWLKAGGPKDFSLFTPWLRVNGKNMRIPVDYFPAEQTVKITKAGKYLKPGENEISFSFRFDNGNYCEIKKGDSCEGCRYWVEGVSFFE